MLVTLGDPYADAQGILFVRIATMAFLGIDQRMFLRPLFYRTPLAHPQVTTSVSATLHLRVTRAHNLSHVESNALQLISTSMTHDLRQTARVVEIWTFLGSGVSADVGLWYVEIRDL